MVKEREKAVPKRRRGYYYKNDVAYPSVTTILRVMNKPALFYWGIKQATMVALDNPELSVEEVRAKVLGITKSSAERGQAVHGLAELWSEKGLLPVPHGKYEGYIRALRDWLKFIDPKPLGHEIEVFSEKGRYAGRCDLVCEIKGETWLIDFKTGKNIYPEVALQLVAYAEGLKEMGLHNIQNTAVVLLMEGGQFSFRLTHSDIEDFLAVKKVWEWSVRKGVID